MYRLTRLQAIKKVREMGIDIGLELRESKELVDNLYASGFELVKYDASVCEVSVHFNTRFALGKAVEVIYNGNKHEAIIVFANNTFLKVATFDGEERVDITVPLNEVLSGKMKIRLLNELEGQ